jgi:predicted permease
MALVVGSDGCLLKNTRGLSLFNVTFAVPALSVPPCANTIAQDNIAIKMAIPTFFIDTLLGKHPIQTITTLKYKSRK